MRINLLSSPKNRRASRSELHYAAKLPRSLQRRFSLPLPLARTRKQNYEQRGVAKLRWRAPRAYIHIPRRSLSVKVYSRRGTNTTRRVARRRSDSESWNNGKNGGHGGWHEGVSRTPHRERWRELSPSNVIHVRVGGKSGREEEEDGPRRPPCSLGDPVRSHCPPWPPRPPPPALVASL